MRINYTLAKSGFSLAADILLPDNGITVLYGPSGCGKTTLLRCIAGLEPAAAGAFVIGSHTWQSCECSLPAYRRPIGFVFQTANLFGHLSVGDNICYGWKRIPRPLRRDLTPILDILGIGDLLSRKPHQLSGGQAQRVGIARALAVSPQLLLMDEPLSSLDESLKREILPYIEKLRSAVSIPVLYVTHSMAEVARLADYIIVMKNGRVCAQGGLCDVLTNTGSALRFGEEAGTVLTVRVGDVDTAWHLARMDFDGGSIWIRNPGLALGTLLRIRILARDVSLASEHPSTTSIQNIFDGVLQAIGEDEHPGLALVRIKVGESFLLARLTGKAAHHLRLGVGAKVWVQVKSAAVVG